MYWDLIECGSMLKYIERTWCDKRMSVSNYPNVSLWIESLEKKMQVQN